MTENINLESSNLSIPEDAFDQFQRNSMYEEEEYITLSDIVSPEPNVPLLPSDISEIPYDNEVVLSANDYPILSDDLSGGVVTTEPTDFNEVSTNENNVTIELVEQIPDQNKECRPKRVRKTKSYVDEQYESNDNKVETKVGRRKKGATSKAPASKNRRGRKPKQNIAQNETDQPDYINSVQQTSKTTKRGRKKIPEQFITKNFDEVDPAENQEAVYEKLSESLSQDTQEILSSTKSRARNKGIRRNNKLATTLDSASKTPDTGKVTARTKGKPISLEEQKDSNTLEVPVDAENNFSGELVGDSSLADRITKHEVPKKKLGRRGKSTKLLPEEKEYQQLELHESLPDSSDISQELNENAKDINSSGTQRKKPGRRAQKDKVLQEHTAEANDENEVSDDDDELDNVSLKMLSKREGDNTTTALDKQITDMPYVKSEDLQPTESEEIDVGDDMALSQLKETLDMSNTEIQDMELDETVGSLNSELNIDGGDDKSKILENGDGEKYEANEMPNDSLLMEDKSKRPTRRRARKVMHYDEGSDEDPFANIELSDDEPSGKKGRYYSDDEYIPGSENKKGNRVRRSTTTDDDTDMSDIVEDYPKGKRRRLFSSNKSSQGNKSKKDEGDTKDINVTTIAPKAVDDVDDIEVCLQSSVIHTNENSAKHPTSVYTNEFENFLAKKIQGTNIQIKKVSTEQSSQSTPLEIPVLALDAKKTVEVSVQTNTIKTTSSGVQTNIQHEVPMKNNVTLTTEQAQKACEFLKSIVKTTSELGQLMTEKSEDFITKKINTNHVTDTFKMDYCVKKSFLLLKLAKHNIVQMEDDLAKQYEEFLKDTNLISHRQEEKTIIPTVKDSDSDCEIVEESQSATPAKQNKGKFNPKTVFLNKELSIKIAKKPASKAVADKCKNTLNIKNKGSVWISNSVMVKKVKPTQSFLAQDSRNKKPPDNFVTEKMVSDFFDTYYKKMAPLICAPFTSTEWHGMGRNFVCNYFFVKSDKACSSTSFPIVGEIHIESNNNDTPTRNANDNAKSVNNTYNPEPLMTLCTEAVKKQMKLLDPTSSNVSNLNPMQSPNTLFRLCLNVISGVNDFSSNNVSSSHRDCKEEKLDQSSEFVTLLRIEKVEELFDFKPREEFDNESPKTSIYIELKKESSFVEDPKVTYVESDTIQPIDKNTEGLINDKQVIAPAVAEKNKEQLVNSAIMTLQTMCFKKIANFFLTSFEEESNFMENDDSISEDNFLLSEAGSYDLSVSNRKIDDMIAELDAVVKNDVKSLSTLCIEFFQKTSEIPMVNDLGVQEKGVKNNTVQEYPNNELDDNIIEKTPNSLKHLTLELVKNMVYNDFELHSNIYQNKDVTLTKLRVKVPVYKVKSLADLCFQMISLYTSDNSEKYDHAEQTTEMTINCVNTLSEEAFHNMEEENLEEDDGVNYYDEDNYDGSFNNFEDEQDGGNNWESQVQLQEFKPCLETNKQSVTRQLNEDENFTDESSNLPAQEPVMAHVKLEPLDEPSEVDSTIVKTEPIHHDEMTVIPETVVTKRENTEDTYDTREKVPLQRQNSSSFDVDTFEDFVRGNKMMHALDEQNDEVFTQSEVRVKRQHEPDYMNEYDPSLNLLIPQTFEPLSVVNAKGVLMASSSDEENSSQKPNAKKKADKKGKGRPKKGESKQQNKDAVSSKQHQDITNVKQGKEPAAAKGKIPIQPPVNEVAMLTRRMREKIRQEEKKIESSDSEGENVPIARKKEKDRKENEKSKSSKSHKDEIQCSNVDSTEQVEQNDSTEDFNQFTGFSSVDQNEISSYQKYVKYVYDKILPKETESNEQVTTQDKESTGANIPDCISDEIRDDDGRSESPLINYDAPTEMLECEPTMPIFDDNIEEKKQRKRAKPKSKAIKEKEAEKARDNITEPALREKELQTIKNDKLIYNEHNGWHCYPIDPKETKLYQSAAIILEKLPESFVETYFEYLEIADKQDEDKEVDRLINLNTLNRTSIQESQKQKLKRKETKDGQLSKTMDTSRAGTPTSDGYAELTASEEEGANVDDEIPPPVAIKHTNENNLAKNSLMNDSDSDEGSKVKEEPNDNMQTEGPKPQSKKKSKGRGGRETQVEVKSENPEALMLTADKMMNKELNLLHAPVVLSEVKEVTGKGDKGPSPKNKHKRGLRGHSSRDHIKNEEDSSSEEEKQWVSTKEKLLKRMGKKQDTTSADDAKRAKLVTEFIERREVAPRSHKRGGRGRGRRRNSRKVLEREKQMRVLSHELFGTPVDPALMGTRHAQFSQSYFKGRRNIRKVIDKKSLARSTVIANMEEFERKCRLNQRQAQLRELLGCEEGVNVLVINDEVCLEYGFDEQRPVVSVHPFFTKVMKAHQYEGVKFMWDACFETLEKVESGHPGGGCILAHCMGLGKTLQVLALLHTVLTHPRVGMQRILVCCPLSTVLNWVDEIHKWIGPVTDQIKVFELSKLKKTYERAYQLEDWYSGGGIFIIGYELFRSLTTLDPELDDVRPTIVNKIRTALLDPGPDIVVCDEGHLLKNDCSVLAVAMSRVATKRRIVLTGTPMQNNLREYYCMVNFVKPNLLGTYSEYSNRFENPIMNGQHRDSREEDIKLMKQRTHILHKVLEGCLQRQEASVLYPYLPKKHEYTVFISLTKVQWDLYKHYINYFSNNCKQSVLKDFHILQKIWSHPLVLHNFQTKKRDEVDAKIKAEKLEDDLAHEELTSEEVAGAGAAAGAVAGAAEAVATAAWWLRYLDGGSMLDSLDCSNKFLVVFKILDECIALGDKVLIFSTSLFTMDALEYFLKKINKWSLGQEYYRLDGSVPAEVRQKWCREFNAEQNLKTKLFLISTRAGSLGLNMVAANRVIILDTSWNPAHDIQSIFRVYRFGQKKDCYIYRLVALGTMEQKIYERSVTKQAVSCRVVDEQQIDRHYNMAELTELYKYDEMGLSVSGGVAVGVTDVALLRVARHPALHAVHEHDSLLRGSSEQQLPEHERAAAWMQFQQEHAHKQMQNQLTSSFSLHLPTPAGQSPSQPPLATTYQLLVDGSGLHAPLVKTETPSLLVPYTPKNKPGRPKKKVTVSVPQPPPPPSPDAEAIQENMSKKIMNILLRHNYQNRQGPGEIARLVSTVRRIVAYGHVPKDTFDNNVAQQIADVLLMKAPATATQQDNSSQNERRKRGRPRKQENTDAPTPSTSQSVSQRFDYSNLAPGRRRAAINADKQIDSFKESAMELDGEETVSCDEDWNDSGEEIVPETKPQKKTPPKSAPVTVKTEDVHSNRVNESDSIVLSDDDEPVPVTTKTKETKKPEPIQTKKPEPIQEKVQETAVASQEGAVPLHPSLLSNKNFIKIVAHTYLEGNPMLDEDAATLAAQYSTLKAKKEIEATGNPIYNGPIYDIAVKVLGIDILKKLHKANPVSKETESNTSESGPSSQVVTKTEPVEETTKALPEAKKPVVGPKKAVAEAKKSVAEAKKPMAEAKRPMAEAKKPIAEAKKPMEEVKKPVAETEKPVAETRRPGLRLKAKGIRELMGRNSPTPAPAPIPAPAPAPAVVPVGLINRSIAPTGPARAPAPPAREESILPDDDDVIIGDQPSPLPKSIFKKSARPLILNSVLASTKPRLFTPALATALPSQPKIPKLVISAGKLLPATGFVPKVVPTSAPAPPTSSGDTICLDSDEETITPNEPAPAPKRVALKSTARPHVAPVPVSITAANPQLNAILNPQQPLGSPHGAAIPVGDAQLSAMLGQPAFAPQAQFPGAAGGKFFVMPADQARAHGLIPNQNYNVQSPVYQHAYTSLPQNVMHPMPSLVQSSAPMGYAPVSAPSTYAPAPAPTSAAYAPAPVSAAYGPVPVSAGYGPVPVSAAYASAPAPPAYAPNPVPPPTAPEHAPPPKGIATKTVCKPGDILRITKTGQIEVLNRVDEDVTKVDNAAPTNQMSQSQPTKEPMRTRGRAAAASQAAPTPPPKTYPSAAPRPAKSPSPEKTASYERSRSLSVSSSSSSDSSRASSPDPLSILKDVVHIKAPEDNPGPKPTGKSTVVGSTSIKSVGGPNKPSTVKTFSREPSQTPTKPSQDDIMKHISKTDTILKRLDKALGSGKQTPVQNSKSTILANTRSSPQTIDMIDLDSYETPINSKQTARPAPAKPQAKPAPAKQKEQPVKVVGTSKDIIISVSGKSSTLTNANSGSKGGRVTSVEKAIPSTSTSKKRPAPSDAGPQKKKSAPMTLKDFNIDDIDDIIELE